MKALITDARFSKEYESKFGTMYSHIIVYDDKKAFYSSKSKDQTKFIPGQEAEFTEETKYYTAQSGEQMPYLIIKPLNQNRQSNFGKAIGKEKARYSAMAMSYSKDLVVAGNIKLDDLIIYARMMFDEMNDLDKKLES